MRRNWKSGPAYYKQGSFHNKLGMVVMWLFLIAVALQVLIMIFN